MTSSPDPTSDDRAARRVLLLAGVALAAVLVGLVVVTVTKLVRGDDGGDAPAVADGGTVTADGAVASVGPAGGVDVPGYVQKRTQALADAKGTRLAVVSLANYRTEAAARELVAPDGVEVIALLVAAPGGAPEVVTGSMAQWADRVRKDAIAERTAIAELLPTVEDKEFAAFYREELVRLDALANTTRADAAVVFAVAVQGSAAELRDLAVSSEVRLVDVASRAKAADGIAYAGLRPEETVRTGTPDLRP